MEKANMTEMETVATPSPMKEDGEDWRSPMTWQGKLASTIYRKKFLYTMCLLFGNFMSGWVNGQRGPALLDLQLITGASLGKGSAFFTAAAAGSVVGAVAGGVIYDMFNKYMSLFIAMAGHGITVAIIPLCSQYWLMIAVFVAHEFFLGIFKTGSNVELIRVWGVESKPYMQSLHFLWSLGGIISPFVLAPFLAVKEENSIMSVTLYNNSNQSLTFAETSASPSPIILTNMTNSTSSVLLKVDHYSPTRILWPFLITGILTLLSSVPFLIVFIVTGSKGHKDITKALTSKREEKVLSLKLLILTLGLLGIFYFFLDEVEDSSVAFLSTYVVKQLNWTKIHGAWITSTFWGAYALGRLASIFFINHVSNMAICGVFFVLLVLSQIAMIFAGTFMSNPGIWITACAVGFSISISFPAMLTWIEKDFVKLSGKIMSVIFIAVGFGGMVNPLIIGPLMETYTPLWYNYIMTIESVMLLLSFLMLVLLVKKVLRKYHRSCTEESDVEVLKVNSAENTNEELSKNPL